MNGPTAARPRPPANKWSWFILILAALGIAFVPLPADTAVPGTAVRHRHLRVEASSFEFRPGVIQVNPGDRVTIELVSTDVVHGLYLDGYDLQVTADPGQPATLSFIADQRGTFRFRCATSCGALHPFMIGKLQVGSNGLLWRGIGLAVLAVLAGFRGGWR